MVDTRPTRPLWTCPKCERRFANRNQSHACGRHDLASHLRGRPAWVQALYRAFVRHARACGPLKVLPEKTRIAFQVRMSFAAVHLGRAGLRGHLVLSKRTPDRHFWRIDTISARNHVHHFQLHSVAELDRGFDALLRAAYAVGEQRHLARRRRRLVV
jgi:hypothetical protein